MPDDDSRPLPPLTSPRSLREQVREGTLRRMRKALVETEARRDALIRDIGEVSGDDGYDAETALAVLKGMDPPRRPAGFVEECPRYPAEDGPGAGARVELTVRVLVGSERSTVIVADPISGRALAREVIPHGGEAGAAAAAVEAAIRARMPSAPGGVPGGLPEAPGEPRE